MHKGGKCEENFFVQSIYQKLNQNYNNLCSHPNVYERTSIESVKNIVLFMCVNDKNIHR